MSESVVLPALGESVTEGTVTRWLKKVGDAIAVDEPLVEVSTDKVDTEIPSPVAGIIEQILVQEDETVQVGARPWKDHEVDALQLVYEDGRLLVDDTFAAVRARAAEWV